MAVEQAPEQLYLDVSQLADLVGVSTKTIIRWSLESRSMPVLRRGRILRFPRARILAWLEGQEQGRSASRAAQGQHKAALSLAK